MALVVPDVGEELALQNFLNQVAPQDQLLKLYTNNITPSELDLNTTYTEASGFGYAAKALTGPAWVIVQGAPSQAAYPQQTFTFLGPVGNVYGYFIVQNTSGKLMWAERFTAAPFVVANNGDAIKIDPQITAT